MAMIEVQLDGTDLRRAVRAVADVIEVDEGDGFCASVYVRTDSVAVVRLDRSLRGARHEGGVRRRVMEHAIGMHGPGYFEWRVAI